MPTLAVGAFLCLQIHQTYAIILIIVHNRCAIDLQGMGCAVMLQLITSYVNWDHVLVIAIAVAAVVQFFGYSLSLIAATSIGDGVRRSTFWLGMFCLSLSVIVRLTTDDVSGDILLLKVLLVAFGVTLSVVGGLFKILGATKREAQH